jgi:hypothetical protein
VQTKCQSVHLVHAVASEILRAVCLTNTLRLFAREFSELLHIRQG